jgi:hypothetical protein
MIGDLVQTTTGTWIVRAPTHCPQGHLLGPNRTLVGHTARAPATAEDTSPGCADSAIRRCTGCRLNTYCSVLTGPAAVRIRMGSG